jgi:hypothetical protein
MGRDDWMEGKIEDQINALNAMKNINCMRNRYKANGLRNWTPNSLAAIRRIILNRYQQT